VLLDVGRVLDLLPGDSRFEALGPDLDSTERHKGQVATDEALLDGRELRLVGLDVDVDVLQLADLLAVAVYQHLAVPLRDVPLGILLVLSNVQLGIWLVPRDVQLDILLVLSDVPLGILLVLGHRLTPPGLRSCPSRASILIRYASSRGSPPTCAGGSKRVIEDRYHQSHDADDHQDQSDGRKRDA
jgi:hypothetical protein